MGVLLFACCTFLCAVVVSAEDHPLSSDAVLQALWQELKITNVKYDEARKKLNKVNLFVVADDGITMQGYAGDTNKLEEMRETARDLLKYALLFKLQVDLLLGSQVSLLSHQAHKQSVTVYLLPPLMVSKLQKDKTLTGNGTDPPFKPQQDEDHVQWWKNAQPYACLTTQGTSATPGMRKWFSMNDVFASPRGIVPFEELMREAVKKFGNDDKASVLLFLTDGKKKFEQWEDIYNLVIEVVSKKTRLQMVLHTSERMQLRFWRKLDRVQGKYMHALDDYDSEFNSRGLGGKPDYIMSALFGSLIKDLDNDSVWPKWLTPFLVILCMVVLLVVAIVLDVCQRIKARHLEEEEEAEIGMVSSSSSGCSSRGSPKGK